MESAVKLGPEDSKVVVPVADQILLIRRFRDKTMQGVLLEDDRTLGWYGLTEHVEANLFLRRTNPCVNEVGEVLLIDAHHLTPGQKQRMRDACAEQDVHYFRHCMQM